MSDRDQFRFLWWWTLSEVAFLLGVYVVLIASLVGYSSTGTDISRSVRLGAVTFLTLELLIPAWVYLDLRRRSADSDTLWVHVAAMPVINLFGFIAYLQHRKLETEP